VPSVSELIPWTLTVPESAYQTTNRYGKVLPVKSAPVMRYRIIITILSLWLFTAWPTTATPPYTAIVIDSGSPYFVPKSATVSSGSPIRWENPTATEHTITHFGCLEDPAVCAFDSGIVLPNGSFTLPGLIPGRYPYFCRHHPIMHGVITVSDAFVPSEL
jgi:plastocyanin